MTETFTPTDAELLSQLKNGDAQALTLLFQRYYQPLCRFVFVFIPENEVAEELSANVFIKLWENRNKITIYYTLRAYLFQSAKNQTFSYLRKRKIDQQSWADEFEPAQEKGHCPEALFIANELNDEFAAVFSRLPQRAQLAFKLHRFDGLKYKEIANVMEISVAAVEKNITTALKILHRELIEEKISL
ncbi:RNA polymerase sigma factor [Mangrovibacterium lignilyticum]|uniref:RNA polymerase sigma factor n=1 Tax=Mangrovibacterium lignilyticum TaxID=2668052 RepID=UPI0013D6DA30|nr:RNA polymerase sigma-70 factor [Mangrovibacterium lignilyticum]